MEDKTIPYIAHESEVSRLERIIKRFWVLSLVIFLALIGTNIFWIWNNSQYQDITTTETYTTESNDGGTAIINGEGSVIINGQGDSN